ncbi:RNA polymerase sigma-70 factor [Halalkalibaculum sp. DA3122]|uniref:RNA polymerase sigma-70 factor n=1 Tax=unclassified Halalkalibaculum TaxID=2964617 RepID=UPI0037550051
MWIEKIQRGDHQAFEKLFKEYYLSLTRFAWRYVKSKAIAEEIVQDVFADLWDNREDWRIDYSIRSYLYKTVKNESLNHLKHQKIEEKYAGKWTDQKENPTIEFDYELREEQIREAVKKAIDELPRRAKMTYKLHRHDGLTYHEIAEVMEISVKTVESQMTRTLKTLRERLSYLLPIFLTFLIV